METTEPVAPATPTDTPAPVETTPEPSIADHEATYGKAAKTAVDVEPGGTDNQPPLPRHRAKKDVAKAADVPRIAELTKKLRDAERERDEWKTKVSSAPPIAPQLPVPTPTPVQPPAVNGTDKPTWKAFEAKIGETYQTWGEAQDAFADARDEWKEAQRTKQTSEQQQTEAYQAVLKGYSAKAQEYGKTVPDFFDKMASAKDLLDGIPDLLFQAIVRDDKGPEIAYALVTRPDQLDEMCLLTDGKAVTPQSVALLQRRLSHYRVPAAGTGSVAPPPLRIAPRPPNPVRTGPLSTGDEPPGDDASIAEHERIFGKKRRR